MARLVAFDMDGVLADCPSSWVHVHKHFKVSNDQSLYEYLRGEIDDLEFISRDIRLWMRKEPGITADRIDELLSDVPLMPGARETIKQLRGAGFKTAIVSAGIDLLAERISRELSIDLHYANGFVTDAEGRLTGEGVLKVRLMDKGDAVTAAAHAVGADMKDIVSVGNSRYDIPMFERSSFGIAFYPSDPEVKKQADAVVKEKDLAGILKFIDTRARR